MVLREEEESTGEKIMGRIQGASMDGGESLVVPIEDSMQLFLPFYGVLKVFLIVVWIILTYYFVRITGGRTSGKRWRDYYWRMLLSGLEQWWLMVFIAGRLQICFRF